MIRESFIPTHVTPEPDRLLLLNGRPSGSEQIINGLVVIDGGPAADDVAQAVHGEGLAGLVLGAGVGDQADLKREGKVNRFNAIDFLFLTSFKKFMAEK